MDIESKKLYLVLVDAPYPDDGVPPSREEPVQRRVQLQRVHPISIVLLHLVSNDIGHLKHKDQGEHGGSLGLPPRPHPHNTLTSSCTLRTRRSQAERHTCWEINPHRFILTTDKFSARPVL